MTVALPIGILVGIGASAYLALVGTHRQLDEPFYPFVLWPMVLQLVLVGVVSTAHCRATGKSVAAAQTYLVMMPVIAYQIFF